VVERIQRALDPLCLAFVHVNPESRVSARPGPAARELAQDGWRVGSPSMERNPRRGR